jgi:hypothetical protein
MKKLYDNSIIARTNQNFIDHIIDHLLESPAHGPVDPLPRRDHVDMTLYGASIWEELYEQFNLRDHYAYYFVNYDKYLFKMTCCAVEESRVKDLLESGLEECGASWMFACDGPRFIGEWRDRWWRSPFSRGYRIDAMCRFS